MLRLLNFLSDFEKYSQMDLVSELEKPVPYKNPGNLMWWQLKPECYDQFCLLYSDMLTSVYLNTPSQSTVLETRAVSTHFLFFGGGQTNPQISN